MSEPFIAQIIPFAGNFAPRGWAFCDGQLLPIAQNTALFSLLGTTYGGNGQTTFGLPNLQGRAAMHAGSGPGLTPRRLGETGGAESVTLTVANLPPHTHGVTAQMRAEGRPGTATDPTGAMLAAGSSIYLAGASSGPVDMDPAMIAVTENQVGGGQSVPTMQPYLVLNYIIALQGLYPSRG